MAATPPKPPKSSKELVAAGPPVSLGDDPTFLGVPAGYVAQRPDLATKEGQSSTRPPLYKEGAQYGPNGLAPEIRAQFQVALDAAGLYDKGDTIRLGVWDDASVAAYTKLLRFANQGGRDEREALAELGTLTSAEREERGLGSVGGGPKARSPLVVSLSNPEDLRALASRTARKSLGHGLSEQEMTRFVTAYQTMERESQQQAEAASVVGGTVTGAPDPTTFAESQVATIDPLAAEATRQVEMFKAIAGELGGMRG